MWENYVFPPKNCTLCFFIHSLQKYNHFSNVCMKVYERFCKRTSRHFTFPFLKRFNDRFLMVCLSWFFQKIVLYVLFNHTVEKYNHFSKCVYEWFCARTILCTNIFNYKWLTRLLISYISLRSTYIIHRWLFRNFLSLSLL